MSQTRHEPVTVMRVLLPVGSTAVPQYAEVQIEASNIELFEQLDQLAALLSAGWHVPFTTRILLNEAPVLALIDQVRLGVPQQVQAARRLLQQREQVLQAAQAEADALVAEARRQHCQRSADAVVTEGAAVRAAQVEEQARRTAAAIQRQADDDVVGSLRWLRAQLVELDQVLARQLRSDEQAGEPADADLQQLRDLASARPQPRQVTMADRRVRTTPSAHRPARRLA